MTHRKSCVQEVLKRIAVKPELAESQFPAMKYRIHRSIPEAMMPEYVVVVFDNENALSGKRPIMKGKRERTGHLNTLNVCHT